MRQARIIGTGSAIPKKILTNNDLEDIIDTTDGWIMRRTGIKERRVSSKGEIENTADLATRASSKALEMAGISPESLDMIVVGTVTPDNQFPSTACMVQEKLNADNVPAFDVSAGCSGFLYALNVVENAIRCGTCRTGLVVGVERLSAVTNWQDRSTCVLLGDGAGAVVVTSTAEGEGILSTHLRSDGAFWEYLYASYGNNHTPEMLQSIDVKPFYLIMDGNRLFKLAVGCLSSIAEEAMQHNSLSSEDIGLVVPHQANMRIIQTMAKNIRIPMKKVYTNIEKYGNTSSASVPIALDEANREGLLRKGDYVLLVAFGAGLTWGASILRWSI